MATIFNSTITSSEWLVNKSFSPRRSAMGYQALYPLYRILNDIKSWKSGWDNLLA